MRKRIPDFEEELEVERVEEKKVYRRVVKFIEIKKKTKFKNKSHFRPGFNISIHSLCRLVFCGTRINIFR